MAVCCHVFGWSSIASWATAWSFCLSNDDSINTTFFASISVLEPKTSAQRLKSFAWSYSKGGDLLVALKRCIDITSNSLINTEQKHQSTLPLLDDTYVHFHSCIPKQCPKPIPVYILVSMVGVPPSLRTNMATRKDSRLFWIVYPIVYQKSRE